MADIGQCDICGLLFLSVVDLNSHLKTHSGYESENGLKLGDAKTISHKENRVNNISHSGTEAISPSHNGLIAIDVSHDGKASINLEPHMKKHTDDDECDSHNIDVSNDVIQSHICSICQMSFFSADILKKHLELHNPALGKPFKCYMCNMAFKLSSSLKGHILQIHSDDSNGGQNVPKAFNASNKYTGTVKSILERLRNPDAPGNMYECSVCKKQYYNTSSLGVHQRTKRHMITPYQCRTCNMFFAKAKNFKKHTEKCGSLAKQEVCREPEASNTTDQTLQTSDGDRNVMATQSEAAPPIAKDLTVVDQTLPPSNCDQDAIASQSKETSSKAMPLSGSEPCQEMFVEGERFQNHTEKWASLVLQEVCKKRTKDLNTVDQTLPPSDRDDKDSKTEATARNATSLIGSDPCEKMTRDHHAVQQVLSNANTSSNNPLEKTSRRNKSRKTCGICQQKFQTYEALALHFKSHIRDRVYKCAACHKAFLQAYQLERHIMAIHSAEGRRDIYQCAFCHMCYTNENKIRMHMVCHKLYQNKPAENEPSKDKPTAKVQYIQCKKCGKFCLAEEYLTHLLVIHKLSFSRQQQQKATQLSGAEPCEGNLIVENQHLKKATRSCSSLVTQKVCEEETTDLSTVDQSLPPSEGDRDAKDLKPEELATSTVSHSGLDPCEEMTPDYRAVQQDFNKSNTETTITVQKKSRCTKNLKPCGICQQQFQTANALKFHFKTHMKDRLFKCALCEKAFFQAYQLIRHTVAVHSAEGKQKIYQCAFCNRCYNDEKKLRRHVLCHKVSQNKPAKNDQPAKEQPKANVQYRQCNLCGKLSSEEEYLSHLLMLHKIPFLYNCPPCNLMFESFESCAEHMKKHKETQAHVCSFCKADYNTESALANHMQFCKAMPNSSKNEDVPTIVIQPIGKAEPSDAPLVVCYVCGVSFTGMELLQDHIKKSQCSKTCKSVSFN